jgi:hypothetical protein
MRDGSRVRLPVAPQGRLAITSILPDGWCRVVFPFPPRMCLRRHARQRIEVNQPPDGSQGRWSKPL